MTDFRALCAELVELSASTDSISQLTERLQKLAELANRARAALAQSESAPTVKESLAAPTGSLVERVKRRMIKGLRGTWEETSCDVLCEVATWFRTERDSPETAAVLEQEASR